MLNRFGLLLIFLGAAFLSSVSLADQTAPDVSPLSNWPVVLFTFIGIIGFILFLAWVTKKVTGLTGVKGSGLRVVSAIPLGAKERIALIDVNGKQILVGITSQNINHLCTFDEKVIDEGDPVQANPQSDFAAKLQGLLTPVAKSRAEQESKSESRTEGKTDV